MSMPSPSPPPPSGGGASSTGFGASTHARWLWPSAEALLAMRRRAQTRPRARLDRQRAQAAAAAAAAATAAASPGVTMAPASPGPSPSSGDVPMSPSAAAAAAPVAAAAAVAPVPAPSKKKDKKAADAASLEPLTLDEERQLRLFYAIQLSGMAQILKLPTHVAHAALIFFHRFFLHQSVMEYSPKDIAYCCIYLACKSEEHHLPLERMIGEINKTQQSAKDASASAAAGASATPVPAVPAAPAAAASAQAASKTVSTVLSLEVPVLSALRFQLRIFHLARASRGLLKELEETEPAAMAAALYVNATDPALTQKGAPGTALQSVAQFFATRATRLHEHALLTDAVFLHAPAQIALAAIQQAEQEARDFAQDGSLDTTAPGSAANLPAKSLCVVDRFLERAGDGAAVAQLRAKLASLQLLLAEGARASSSIDKRALKAIEKRRKAVANSALDPASAEATAARAEREAVKDQQRAAKKKKQREENQLKENALLMDDDMPSAGGAGDGEFKISKRLKSAHSTPIQSQGSILSPRTREPILMASFDSVPMSDVKPSSAPFAVAPSPPPAANGSPAKANLSSLFADAME